MAQVLVGPEQTAENKIFENFTHIAIGDISKEFITFVCYIQHNFSHVILLSLESVSPNFVACSVFLGIEFSFSMFISS